MSTKAGERRRVRLRDSSDVLVRPVDPVDHHNHEALVAVEADSGEGVGVAKR